MVNKNLFTKKILIIFLSILFLDVLTKQIIKSFQINTTTGIVDITYTTNQGSLFSLFSNVEWINLFFILASIFALIALYFIWQSEKINSIPLIFIFTGVLGNLIDRLLYSEVIDWINFHFWPVFNIADSVIVMGVVWILINIFLESKTNNSKN